MEGTEHFSHQLAIQMKRAIELIAGRMIKPGIVTGKAVNVTDLLCDIDRGEGSPIILGARLNAMEEQTDTYCTTVPKEGSWVLAGWIEGTNTEAVVLATTEVEKLICKLGEETTCTFQDGSLKMQVGNKKLEVTEDAVVMNNGANGSMIIIQMLVNKMNRLENKVNEHLGKWNAFCSAYIAGSPTITGAPATLSTSNVATISPLTMVSDIENPDVKH